MKTKNMTPEQENKWTNLAYEYRHLLSLPDVGLGHKLRLCTYGNPLGRSPGPMINGATGQVVGSFAI